MINNINNIILLYFSELALKRRIGAAEAESSALLLQNNAKRAYGRLKKAHRKMFG